MSDNKRLVLCSHCAARLTLPAASTRTHFKCAKCGERTTIQLGAALAQNTTNDASDQADELKQMKILVRIIALILGFALLAGGTYTQLGGCAHDHSSTHNVDVRQR